MISNGVQQLITSMVYTTPQLTKGKLDLFCQDARSLFVVLQMVFSAAEIQTTGFFLGKTYRIPIVMKLRIGLYPN